MDRYFIVKIFDNLRRIDNWVFSYFKRIPKSAIYKYIRKGNIKVNNKLVYPNLKVKTNDLITFKNIYYINNNEEKYIHKYFFSEEFKKSIIYEDDFLLSINKPYGISVHGGKNNKYNIISSIKSIYNNNYDLVHRLDKFSSGVLLISKNKYILRKIHLEFFKKNVIKKYLILVKGIWNEKNNIINESIYKKINIYKKKVSIIDNKIGKKSLSLFKIIKKYKNMTLLEVTLNTGRMHQIRIHSSYVGNPIVMDNLYGDIKYNKSLINIGLKRMFLHSNKIIFFHPIKKNKIEIKSNLDSNLLKFLKRNDI